MIEGEERVIEAAALTKRFGGLVAVDSVTLEVAAGEVFGFLGPNGAGKTTTIRMLLGLSRATTGSARILGLDVWRDKVALHRRLGYVPAETSLWPHLRGAQILDLLASLHGPVERSRRDELCDRFDFDPSKKGREYSRGSRQKLALIAAFSTRADVLLLDEPATGLDPLMGAVFRAVVRERADDGVAVLLSSHMLGEVDELCDRVGILRSGRLVESGTPSELKHLGVRRVEIEFQGTVADLHGVPGLVGLRVHGQRVGFELHGEIQPVLDALVGTSVIRLETTQPSLEEAFLTYYQKSKSQSEGRDPDMGSGSASEP